MKLPVSRLPVSRASVALAAAAALSLCAMPAMARGWHHRDRGIDAGDVLAGLLILGGIAAVASAASKSSADKREREARYPEARYPEDERYRDYPADADPQGRYGEDRGGDRPYAGGSYGGVSLDAAVDQCAAEVERGSRRVAEVDAVSRDGDGWRVEGRMEGGSPFACTVDGDGRIRRATVDGRGVL